MIVEPIRIPNANELFGSFEDAKRIILINLTLKENQLPQGTDKELYQYLQKYYQIIINDRFLNKSPYPIDCILIRELLYRLNPEYLNIFGEKLRSIELSQREEVLNNIFQEARGQQGIELTIKLNSLQAEINFTYLLSKYGVVRKCPNMKGCDLTFIMDGDEWCIQAKQKNDEYFNLCLIANAISSELFIKNNVELRRFNKVVFEGGDIDKIYRGGIVTYFHSPRFIDSLRHCEKYLEDTCSFYNGKIDFPISTTSGFMAITICGNINWVSFRFAVGGRITTIEFKSQDKDNGFQKYGLKNPIFYPEEENLKIDKLNKLLGDIFIIAKQKFADCKISKKALFIQLDVSPQNEENFESCIGLVKKIIEEGIHSIPCIIFPKTWFNKIYPILNQAAERSIFGSIFIKK